MRTPAQLYVFFTPLPLPLPPPTLSHCELFAARGQADVAGSECVDRARVCVVCVRATVSLQASCDGIVRTARTSFGPRGGAGAHLPCAHRASLPWLRLQNRACMRRGPSAHVALRVRVCRAFVCVGRSCSQRVCARRQGCLIHFGAAWLGEQKPRRLRQQPARPCAGRQPCSCTQTHLWQRAPPPCAFRGRGAQRRAPPLLIPYGLRLLMCSHLTPSPRA